MSYPDCPTVRRSVEVGGLSKAELVAALARHAISLNERAEKLLAHPRFEVSGSCYRLSSVELKVRDLGLPGGGTTEEIHEAATARGLAVCPMELGPFLRLQFLDQREGPRLTLSARRLSTDADVPTGFYLRSDSEGLWLRGYTASEDYAWSPEEHFIFRLADR